MCPLRGVGFKWAANGDPDAEMPRPVPGSYAMNMRAADAIVSRAPKAMKIFPISEVLSRWNCRCSTAWRWPAPRGRSGRGHRDRLVRGGGSRCRARSTSLSWSEATTWPQRPGLRVGRLVSRGQQDRVGLASADIALALSAVGASAAAICALALATDAGIAMRVAARVGDRLFGGLLGLGGFRRLLLDLRRHSAFHDANRAWTICRTSRCSDFQIGGVSSAAGCRRRRWSREAYQKPCGDNQGRGPLALTFIGISPFARPRSEKRPRGVSTARQKKGIFGQHRAKTGQCCCSSASIARPAFVVREPADASRRNRCYEPAGRQPAVSIPGRLRAAGCVWLDHDFVIDEFDVTN